MLRFRVERRDQLCRDVRAPDIPTPMVVEEAQVARRHRLREEPRDGEPLAKRRVVEERLAERRATVAPAVVEELPDIRVRIPAQDLARLLGTDVAEEVAVARLVAAAEDDREDPFLEILRHRLTERRLVLLHIIRALEVAKVEGPLQELDERLVVLRIRRESVQPATDLARRTRRADAAT